MDAHDRVRAGLSVSTGQQRYVRKHMTDRGYRCSYSVTRTERWSCHARRTGDDEHLICTRDWLLPGDKIMDSRRVRVCSRADTDASPKTPASGYYYPLLGAPGRLYATAQMAGPGEQGRAEPCRQEDRAEAPVPGGGGAPRPAIRAAVRDPGHGVPDPDRVHPRPHLRAAAHRLGAQRRGSRRLRAADRRTHASDAVTAGLSRRGQERHPAG